MIDLIVDFDKPESKRKLWEYLKTLRGEQVIKIKRKSNTRSNKVNAYYWGVVLAIIAEITGHSPIYLHEYYKYKFIPAVKFTDDSRLTTADMTHEEIWNYINMIREDAKRVLDIDIPSPDGVIL